MTNVLIDADAIFALIVASDPNHKKALKISNKNKKSVISILNTTIAEVATVLFRKIDHEVAMRFLKDIVQGDFIILTTEEKLMSKAILYFEKQKSKKTSFFDCLNMAAMELYKFEALFSFDKGYVQNDFTLLA